MNEVERSVQQAAAEATELHTRLEDIFKEAFAFSEDSKDVGYKAYAGMAIDVAVRLAKMFIAIRRDKGVHSVACDLTFELAANDFWQKNASILVPVLHVALNTHRDGALLLAEREMRNEYSSYDMLIAASRAAPLEVFPIIAYCVGGPALMAAQSLNLKRQLAPLLT